MKIEELMIPVSRHEKALRQMRCVVSSQFPVTLHHCHGGSMLPLSTILPDAFDDGHHYRWLHNPGMGQRANPFFQIPLLAKYHVGECGIDTGMGEIKSVPEWEERFGTQVEHLQEVQNFVGYDIYVQANMWWGENRK